MIPQTGDLLRSGFTFEELPSRTYWLQTEFNKFFGFTDELEAVKQAVYLILNIERCEYIIYSWNYGVELLSLYGKPIPYVLPELKRRIREALLQDSRVTGVEGFSFDVQRGSVHCSFTVTTVFGDFEESKAVDI